MLMTRLAIAREEPIQTDKMYAQSTGTHTKKHTKKAVHDWKQNGGWESQIRCLLRSGKTLATSANGVYDLEGGLSKISKPNHLEAF